jgi:hypothetical protein
MRNGKTIHDGHPIPGFYKLRTSRNSSWVPVAIWEHEGRMVCRVGNTMRDPAEVWLWAAKNPVSKEDALHAFRHGRWPDDPEPVKVKTNRSSDPFEAIKEEIEDEANRAREWLSRTSIDSMTLCSQARNMQASLLSLFKRADKMREGEKKPHMEAAKAVDNKFRSLLDAAKAAADALRVSFEPFLVAEETRRKEEERRKFEEARKAAEEERSRLLAERERWIEEDPVLALTSPPPELPVIPQEPATVKVQAGGGTGRKAGLRSVWEATLVDYDAALRHYASNAKIRALVESLAAADVRAGAREIPGFEIKEKRRVA